MAAPRTDAAAGPGAQTAAAAGRTRDSPPAPGPDAGASPPRSPGRSTAPGTGADTPAAEPATAAAPGGPNRADPLSCVLAALAAPAAASSDHDLTPGARAPEGMVLRPAAVLLALMPGPAGPELILTRRSARLRNHPGQIALPGGGRDPGDPTPESTALREAQEEIGLDPDRVEVLGCLNPHATVTGFAVTPVVGRLRAPFRPVPDPSEVAEVFAVPLGHLTDPARYRLERRRWRGVWRHYYVVPWGPYYIWGATARILHGLTARDPAAQPPAAQFPDAPRPGATRPCD